MNILVSGGAKNGKSMFAQKTAKQMAEEEGLPLYYIATMIPRDDEDEARIARHRNERAGWGFETIECSVGLAGLLKSTGEAGNESHGSVQTEDTLDEPAGVFLLDSVTALLSNEMFREDGSVDHEAAARVAEECVAFAKETKNTVFVSDYIYGDGVDYDKLTEEYRHGLAMIDRRLAQVCERVVEASAGITEDWKTEERPDRD